MERMLSPPSSKKLLSDADPGQAQHLREHLAQRLLAGVRGGATSASAT